MQNTMQKPSIPDVLPLVQAWYAKPGNEGGGIFHIMLDNGNAGPACANYCLNKAQESGDADAIHLAELLVAMSPTQRSKIGRLIFWG